jgi:CubicO group peptidase (beta-lactamase class C family)
MIVEHVAGKPFPAFLEDRFFRPLGMTSAVFGDSRVVVPNRRQVAYTRQYGPLQSWIRPYSTTDYPGAGLNVSAADLAKYFAALQTGHLFRPLTLKRLWTRPVLASGAEAEYALGWTVEAVQGRTVVGHEGGGCAWVSHVPVDGLTVVVLSNLAGSRANLGSTLAALMAS